MERVTGIGGVLFKAKDPQKIQEWYKEHLGIEASPDGAVVFEWSEREEPHKPGGTVWSPFPQDTDYFGKGGAPFMFNYRVKNLDAMLAQLRAAGVQVDGEVMEMEYGRFGWATDPEGNRFELWEPAAGF